MLALDCTFVLCCIILADTGCKNYHLKRKSGQETGCLSGVCEGESSVKREQPAYTGTVVALGDSLTAGYGVKEKESYPVRLEKKLREAGWDWRVINSGICGEASGETLARIDAVLKL